MKVYTINSSPSVSSSSEPQTCVRLNWFLDELVRQVRAKNSGAIDVCSSLSIRTRAWSDFSIASDQVKGQSSECLYLLLGCTPTRTKTLFFLNFFVDIAFANKSLNITHFSSWKNNSHLNYYFKWFLCRSWMKNILRFFFGTNTKFTFSITIFHAVSNVSSTGGLKQVCSSFWYSCITSKQQFGGNR